MKERLDGRISIALSTRHSSWYYQKEPTDKQVIRDKIRQFLEQLWIIEHGRDSEEQIIREKIADAQNREKQLMEEYSKTQSEREAYESYLDRLESEADKEEQVKIEQIKKDIEALRQGPLREMEL